MISSRALLVVRAGEALGGLAPVFYDSGQFSPAPFQLRGHNDKLGRTCKVLRKL